MSKVANYAMWVTSDVTNKLLIVETSKSPTRDLDYVV